MILSHSQGSKLKLTSKVKSFSLGIRYWTDKIRNGLGQMDRRYREVLRWIERNTRKDEDIKGQGEVRSGVEGTIDWPGGWTDHDYEKFSDELYGLLVDRTEGEALERVQGGAEGDGIEAYGRLVLWYMHTTPLNLQKRCAASVTPMPVKKDEDLASAIEKW